MNEHLQQQLMAYWSGGEVWTNFIIFLNLMGSLALGLLVGMERSYRGRAAGMRTYGLVCMAACALTVIAAYPGQWFGGGVATTVAADPTRIIQGIVTGVGFIGAGVIVKEGLRISGLTTAASIWVASAIGVLVGIGFYGAAILLALLTAGCMMWAGRLENWLPTRQSIVVVLRFHNGNTPTQERLAQDISRFGYSVVPGSFGISHVDSRTEWRFRATESGRPAEVLSLTALSEQLLKDVRIDSLHIQHSHV